MSRDMPPFGPEWAPTGNTPEARAQVRHEIQAAWERADLDRPTPDEYEERGR